METINVPSISANIVEAESKLVVVLVNEANSLTTINTQADYLAAGELRSKLKGKTKKLEELRKSATVPLDTAKSIIMGWFKPVAEKIEQAVEYIDELSIAYSNEQDRRAREAQAKADEEARKAREKAEAKAKELEAQGKTEKAQAMQAKADAVIAPVIVAATPKVAGQAIKEVWDFEIIDITLVPRKHLIPNEIQIRKIVNATKGKITISGIRIFSRKIVSGRSI